jgi:hypothetical protein
MALTVRHLTPKTSLIAAAAMTRWSRAIRRHWKQTIILTTRSRRPKCFNPRGRGAAIVRSHAATAHPTLSDLGIIAKRQETAKALVDGGMSKRQAAKVLGVDPKTLRNDVREKSSKSGENIPASKKSAADNSRVVQFPQSKKADACDEIPDVETPAGTSPSEQRRFNFLYRARDDWPIWIVLDLAPCRSPPRGDNIITSTKKPPSWQLDGFLIFRKTNSKC